ncbi:MAG: glycoside hydrolase family 15 protein [Bryobacteraceae bacterium]|nr:glycoside hydrolase family 15 protein [Bryobacteraceae bacterium]
MYRYLRIRDYAVIGDTRTAALVGCNGSIDWCCWPRFDSPAVFCRLLDAYKGGHFQVEPVNTYRVSRSYVGDSNVLVTTFDTGEGQIRIVDFMPIPDTGHDENVIYRLIEGLSGCLHYRVLFRPSFDYAREETKFELFDGGAVASSPQESLTLTCPLPLEAHESGALASNARIAQGERIWLTLEWQSGSHPAARSKSNPDVLLRSTLEYWHDWARRCTYQGPYRQSVVRSALTLKLLTFKPTGALVAAPTTSLPEVIGGVRNWDYRYTWLRDSALVLHALHELGYHEESLAFWAWLERLCHCKGRLQIMYRVDGNPGLPEQHVDFLDGHRGSRPVRIGNAAAQQFQLDLYGEVLDAAHFCHTRMHHNVSERLGEVLKMFADRTTTEWANPDHGIWEMRSEPQHFLYSKLMCWVALDRAVKLAQHAGLSGEIDRWRSTRNEIRNTILTQGYSEEFGAFSQVLGGSALDASALVIPLVGFLPASDPRVHSTVEQIRRHLVSGGLVYRYSTGDGLFGREGTFVLCSFWLIDNLALSGNLDEARDLFERLLGYSNDVGLLSEEILPDGGELLGNFPQGFAHLALIRSALHLQEAANRSTRTGVNNDYEWTLGPGDRR